MQHSGLVRKPVEANDALGGSLRNNARKPAYEEAGPQASHHKPPSHRSRIAPTDPESTPGSPQESRPTSAVPWSFSQVSVHRPEPQPLLVESNSDPQEAAAVRAAATPGTASIAGTRGPGSDRPAPAVVREALASPGKSLDAASRRGFEARYRHDFSGVRLHSDTAAARSAEALDARAFTVGDHIVLGRGGSDHGLLAHELAHVVQQSAARMPWVQCQPNTQGNPPPTVHVDPEPDFPTRMSPREVHEFLGKHPETLLLDVRGTTEWNDDVGHIEGSRQIPLRELGGRIDELDPWRDKPIIIVSRIGDRGGAAVVALREAGFTRVAGLDGGLEAWREAGY